MRQANSTMPDNFFEKHSKMVRFVATPSEFARWNDLFGQGNLGSKMRSLMNQAADLEEIKRGLAQRCECCGQIRKTSPHHHD